MATAAGFAIILGKERVEAFSHQLQIIGDHFSEPVPEFLHSRSAPVVCFISAATGKITHIARGRRGIRAGTGLRRLNLTDVRELRPPVSVRKLINGVSGRLRKSVRQHLTQGGKLSENSLHAMVEIIKQLSPTSSNFLDQFSQARQDSIARLAPDTRQALAYQKEAVQTALNIAGLSRDSLQQWNPLVNATPESFLEGLPSARLREDPMVVNDMMNVPGFDFVRTLPYTAALFEDENGTRLTVILANRQPLERQLGTDLIYYNETFQAFVMVQYKAMEQERDGAVFRLPNEQLKQEVARMDEVLREIRECSANDRLNGFRLNENPFFLKLCPRIIFNPDDIGLVHGMYVPLDYWRLLEADPVILGPKDGQRVTYENVGRYFDNTSFVSLVANAWVGTNINQSAVLRTAIGATLQAGKAIALAVKKLDRARSQTAGSNQQTPAAREFDSEAEDVDLTEILMNRDATD
jgi:hypothetical protein